MLRSNHYELAFEDYLRGKQVGFVAIDEAKRSTIGAETIKSVDFIIVGPQSAKLIVDVKGRKFPSGTQPNAHKTWQNWATQSDIDGLEQWAKHFGPDYRGILAFVYQIQAPFCLPDHVPDQFLHKKELYLMRAIEVTAYRQRMHVRSQKWNTVHLRSDDFRQLVRPFSDFLHNSSFP